MSKIGNLKKGLFQIEGMFNMEEPMDFNSIMIMVGQNGSGKTLVLKFSWLFAMVMSTYAKVNYVRVHRRDLAHAAENYDLVKSTQYLFQHSFDDFDFTGKLIGWFENAHLTITMEKGKILTVEPSINQNDRDIDLATPIFMSKDMRTFNQISQYLTIRKLNGIPNHSTENIEKMLPTYKIYDALYVELLLNAIGDGANVPDKVLARLHDFDGMEKYDVKKIFVDYDTSDIYFTDKDGNRTNFKRLSAGEQSLANMVIGTLMLELKKDDTRTTV